MARDWVGNTNSIFKNLAASNHSETERQIDDYYATDPKALEMLLEHEKFNSYIWECACGGGHLSRVLCEKGYKVKSSDIADRGFEGTEIIDFLKVTKEDIKKDFPRDIITNPPYKYAFDFIQHALEISMDSVKIAMLLKIQFLEGQKRQELFLKNPPKYVYVFSKRIECAKNGNFTGGSAVCYAWFIWEKGWFGSPKIRWL